MSAAGEEDERGGGMPARRALMRWSVRALRREWRQQLLVLTLLVTAVAGAITFGSIVYNTTGVREQARFGSANHRYEVAGVAPHAVREAAVSAREQFGAADVLGRWPGPLPGSVDTVDHLALDPGGAFVGPMVALVSGRFPGAGEAAITDGLGDLLQVGVGDLVQLDGQRRIVVGVVENPSDLERDFVLVAPDELDQATALVVLLGGSGTFDEVRQIRAFGADHLPSAELTSRGDVDRGTAANVVLGAAQVVLVLVCLVASAAFAAVAQRRMRQLGVLGAVGATRRQLTFVVVVHGAAVGALASATGAVVGVGAWFAIAPALEEPVGYRIDAMQLPWLLIVGVLAATIAAATIAAWVPARAAARLPTVAALSDRPPDAASPHRSLRRGVTLTAVGALVLRAGGARPPIAVAGTLLVVVGALMLSPAAAAALGWVARPFPVAVRIALRDVARYQSRSAVALAAVTLSLGIPVAVVVVSSGAEADRDLPNLPPEEVLIWTKDPDQPDGVSPFYTEAADDEGFAPYLPDLRPGELERLADVVAGAAAGLDAAVTPIEAVVDTAARDDPEGTRAVTLARRTEIGYLDVAILHKASPALLERYDVTPDADLLTVGPSGPSDVVLEGSGLWFANTADPPEPVGALQQLDGSYTSLPGSFLTADAVEARGWSTTPIGWLLAGTRPIGSDALAGLRELATREAMVVEAAEEPTDLASLRWGATAVGLLVALAILGMTVGLIRVEAAREARILTATGASRWIRRALTAATAGGLASAGALLATVGAYAVLLAGFRDEVGSFLPVPIAPLAMILFGVPVLATVGGWTAGGREPGALARPVIE